MNLSVLTSNQSNPQPQKRPMRSVLVACLLLITLAVQGSPAMAQEFPPRRGITLLVGFAAGGAADTAARIIARRLADNLGQTVSVDNRPGAGGNIAHQMFMFPTKAAPRSGPTSWAASCPSPSKRWSQRPP